MKGKQKRLYRTGTGILFAALLLLTACGKDTEGVKEAERESVRKYSGKFIECFGKRCYDFACSSRYFYQIEDQFTPEERRQMGNNEGELNHSIESEREDLVQYSFSGRETARFSLGRIKYSDDLGIEAVTEWGICLGTYEGNLYYLPFRKAEKTEQPDWEAIVEIPVSSDYSGVQYMEEDILAYYEGMEYKEYDLKKKEEIPINRDSGNIRYAVDAWYEDMTFCKNGKSQYVILNQFWDDDEDRDNHVYRDGELYFHEFGSGRVEKMPLGDGGLVGRVGYCDSEMVCYTDEKGNVMQYTFGENRTRCLLSSEEIKAFLVRAGKWDTDENLESSVIDIYFYKNRFYINTGLETKDYEYENCAWVSVPEQGGILRYEGKLTDMDWYEETDDEERDGLTLWAVYGEKMMFAGQKEGKVKVYSYDLQTGKVAQRKKGTKEYTLFYHQFEKWW